MSAITSIRELSTLPAPQVVEELSFDTIFQAIWNDFSQKYPEHNALLESDPGVKLVEVAAYRETLLRNRINQAARAQMLAFSTGTDLDHLGAFYGVSRLSGEGDAAMRRRVQLRIMGFSNAGPDDLYRYWALTASPEIADVKVDTPKPGHVRISVLSRADGGVASEEMLEAVRAVVLRDDIRVLTDTVTVQAAEILPVTVSARIWLQPDTVQEIMTTLPRYLDAQFSASAGLGWDCARSWLIGCLHVAGVHKVELLTPDTDVTVADHQAVRLADCTLELAGRGR